MSGTVLANLGLTGDIPDHALWGTEGRANDRRLDALVMASVKDILNAPPASPVDGDRYIVGSSPSGAWSGKAGYVASWNANLVAWDLYAPKTGWRAYLEDERSGQRYVGAWVNDDLALNVKRFGALGDGATDDTAAVLLALAALPANGRIHFPAGTYLLTSWALQTLSKVAWISGDGMGNSIIKGTGGASFLSITANFRCSGITFDTWTDVLDFSAVTTILDRVVIEDVEIKNYRRAIYSNGSIANTGFRGFVVRSCRITTGSQYAIFQNLPIMEDVHVLNNVIKTCVQRAIDLGGNSLVFADDRGNYVIQGNLIDGVTGVGVSALALICYGWRAIITNNVVRNVSRDVATASDCDGIYTKCRYSVIANNVLVDAGQAEAFINVKGGARGETVVQPYGFEVIVANNTLLDTQVGPTLAGGGKKSSGIKIATSDVLVVGNQLDGLCDTGIYTDSDAGSDAPCHNVVIRGNQIKNHRGNSAISIFGLGRRVRVVDNLIDTVSASYDTSKQNSGILISKGGGGDVDISDNRIHTITDNGQTPIGILIKPSVVIDHVRVMDNHVDGATNGIQFSNNAPDVVFIRHNTFGTVVTQVQFSVTPTNLVNLPAQAETVARVSATQVEVKNGVNNQNVEIYGTDDGAGNYERVSVRMDATHATIDVEKGGTGTQRSLELRLNGVAMWRMSASGHLNSMQDAALDIGDATHRPRDVWVGRDLMANAVAGRVYLDYTNIAPGTTGAQTIGKISGRVNAAAGTTSLVVTNSRCTAAAHVFAVAGSNDATGRVNAVVPAAGSFTIFYTAPTAEMPINFVLWNAD